MSPTLAELGRDLDVAEAIVDICDEGFEEFDAARTAYTDAAYDDAMRRLYDLATNPIRGDAETLAVRCARRYRAAAARKRALDARWYLLTHDDAEITDICDDVAPLAAEFLAHPPTSRQRINIVRDEMLTWRAWWHLSQRINFARDHDRDQIKRGVLLPSDADYEMRDDLLRPRARRRGRSRRRVQYA